MLSSSAKILPELGPTGGQVLWILFWLFVMPVLLDHHFVVSLFMWFDWLVVAMIISLIVFGSCCQGFVKSSKDLY